MESERDLEFLQCIPERLVVKVMPSLAINDIGAQKNRAKAEIIHHPTSLFDGVVDVVNRNHAGSEKTTGLGLTEVVQPVVVGAREGRSKPRVLIGVGEYSQAAGGKQHRDVDPFGVHRFQLDLG